MKVFLVAILFMGISGAAFSDESLVAPPPNVAPPPPVGSLQITGEPGAGQPKNIGIRQCRASDNFVADYASCESINGNFLPNGAPIPLAEGVYEVTLGDSSENSIHGVHIEKGTVTSITIPQLQVPKSGTVKFRVFRDLSQQEEQEKLLNTLWTNSLLEKKGGHGDFYCRFNSTQKYCDALRSSPFAGKDILWRFTSKAEMQDLYVLVESGNIEEGYYDFIVEEKWRDPERVYVNETSDTGTSVALFPGIYGIEYFDGPVTSTVYGVVVK